MDPWGSVGGGRRAGAHPGYRPVSARQYRFRRAMVLIAVLSLVALIAGCLGRSGPAPVPLNVAWVFSP
ncbi:MAG TPA: hypothetical protein VNO25_07710, partial [Streptosporangiaceae bacterium]|nr:hypothetical protein [Streptosporangiaceae bacterium]